MSKKNSFLQETRRREKERERSSSASKYGKLVKKKNRQLISEMLDSLTMMAKLSEYENFYIQRFGRNREFLCVIDFDILRIAGFHETLKKGFIEFRQVKTEQGHGAVLMFNFPATDVTKDLLTEHSKYFNPHISETEPMYRPVAIRRDIVVKDLRSSLDDGVLSQLMMMLIEDYFVEEKRLKEEVLSHSSMIAGGTSGAGRQIGTSLQGLWQATQGAGFSAGSLITVAAHQGAGKSNMMFKFLKSRQREPDIDIDLNPKKRKKHRKAFNKQVRLYATNPCNEILPIP